MLSFETCHRLYDAIPAFRDHVPTSGDWVFLAPDAAPRPCLIDTDGAMLFQWDDGEPGVLHREPPPEGHAAFAWCPRLDQLITLAESHGFGTLDCWGPPGAPRWATATVRRTFRGPTPEDAVAALLLGVVRRG